MVMENRQELATALRRRLAQTHPSRAGAIRTIGHAPADACLGGGLRCGALHEVFPAEAADASVASGFALALATRITRNTKYLLWVQQDFAALECGEILGTGFLAFGCDPTRLLIVKVPSAAAGLRAGAEGLNCNSIGAVVIETWNGAKNFDLVASRKLTLAAARNGVTAFVLRHGAAPLPSSAETRWRVRPARSGIRAWEITSFDAELLRNRHGPLGRWIMEWDCNGNFHDTAKAHSGAVPAAPSHRPLAAETEGLRRVS